MNMEQSRLLTSESLLVDVFLLSSSEDSPFVTEEGNRTLSASFSNQMVVANARRTTALVSLVAVVDAGGRKLNI